MILLVIRDCEYSAAVMINLVVLCTRKTKNLSKLAALLHLVEDFVALITLKLFLKQLHLLL